MENILKTIYLLVYTLLISSCSTITGYYEADPLFKQQSDLLKDDEDIIDANKLSARIDLVKNVNTRNALLNEIITISDRICTRHQASIISGLNTWNVATGTLSSLFSAVGTVIGGESVKAALAAGATFTNSTRSLVNEEVYAKALGTTIVAATISAREKQFSVISKGMNKNFDAYSIKAGLRDVYNYQSRCSFYYGLLEITKALNQRKRSKSEIEDVISKLRSQAISLKENGGDITNINNKISKLIIEIDTAPN